MSAVRPVMIPAVSSYSKPTTAGALPVFRVFGVPVKFHFTFVLMALFLVVSVFGSAPGNAKYAYFLLGGLVSLLLHELGHALMAARFGVRTLEVVVFPIGGLARLDRPLRPLAEICVALAGPAVNLLLAAGIFAYVIGTGEATPIHLADFRQPNGKSVPSLLLYGNVLLALCNLLPAFPMDGGRVLRAFLAMVRPEAQATRLAAWLGRMLAMGLGLYGLVAGQFVLVFFALFIYLAAAQEGVAALGRALTYGIPVRAAMITDFHTLDHGQTVRDAANLLLATSQQDFPVMHGGEVVGLLGRNLLMRALAIEGPDAYVAGVMDREFTWFEPDVEIAKILPRMASAGGCGLVLDNGRLLGLVTSENLSELLLLRRLGMEPAR